MPDQAFVLFLLQPVPHIIVVKIMRPALAQIMQQIKVKISCPCLCQGRIKLRIGLFLRLAVDPCRVFGGKLIAFPWITLYQSLADRILAPGICPCRVKICKPGIHKQIHHLLNLLHIHRGRICLIHKRQPHKSKP